MECTLTHAFVEEIKCLEVNKIKKNHAPRSTFLSFLSFCPPFFQVLRYLGVSDGNMAEGSMRLDVNVSLRPKGETCLNTKVPNTPVSSIRVIIEENAREISFICIAPSLYEVRAI